MGFCRENWGSVESYFMIFHGITAILIGKMMRKPLGGIHMGLRIWLGTSLSMESLEYHLAALEWRDRPVKTCRFAVMVGPKSRRDPPIIMEKIDHTGLSNGQQSK